jgi:3-phosphoshikimate 1-carboxyvinyltransferase
VTPMTDRRVIHVPGDKSLTHRALILAALASGRSVVHRPLVGADTESTAGALRALGCPVPGLADGAVRIEGVGLRGLRPPADPIDCGNSGTTARLLLGVLAGQNGAVTLTGDASLRARPMRRVTVPLTEMGARFEELGTADRLPIRVHGGALRPIDYASPHASAQVKSAVLLAALTGGVHASVTEPLPSRDHTERMLARLGAAVVREHLDDGRHRVAIEPLPRLPGFEFEVPADFSSAAFVMAAAALSAPAPVVARSVGLNPGRTGFLDVLRRMGGVVAIENERDSCGEPIGDVVTARSTLRATRVAAAEVPSLIDEIPVIAMLAARAEGTTVIEGAGELRVKESDRISALVANLRAVGVHAEERPDGLVVEGTGSPLRGSVRAMHDHRIAMAFGVLAGAAGADIAIDDPDVVRVSYPAFWDMVREVAA